MPPFSQDGTEASGVDTVSQPSEMDGGVAASAPDTTTNTEGASSAQSPGADSEPKSLLDAVRLAVADTASQADTNSTPATDTQPDVKPEPVAEPGADNAQADADKPPPFHEHPRWKQVVGERDGYKARLAALEPDAQSFGDVRSFMNKNDLSPDEVKQGFAIMAAMKNDPVRAWELLQPSISQLRTFLGHELPPDLRQKVDDGVVDEATAAEAARLRNVSALAQVRAANTIQAQARDRIQADAIAVGRHVDSYISTLQARDPDFQRIEPLLHGAVLQLQQEWSSSGKAFNTPQAAVTLTQQAVDRVKGHLVGMRPARQPIKAPPTGGSTAAATTQPLTLRDAIAQAAIGTYRHT